MKTDDILNDLRSGGDLVSKGTFTLDRSKAREKMADYQLSDPHEYVLRLVEAGHLLGTRVIHVAVDANEVQVDFDAVSLQAGELQDIYNAALSNSAEPRVRAMRQIGIGVTAAEAVAPSVIRVEAYASGHLATLEATRSGDELREEVYAEESDYFMDFLRIYVRESFRTEHLGEFFQARRGALPEQRLVRERCAFSEQNVFLNREGVSRGIPRSPDAPDTFEVNAGQSYGRIWTTSDERDVSLHLIQNGVWIRDYQTHLNAAHGIRGVLYVDHLQKDLSQADFVENDDWDELVESVIPEAVESALRR